MPTLDDPSDFGYFRYWYTTFAPWKNNPMKDIVFDVEKYTFPPVGLRPAAHFPMKPDIYTYPENADPRALLQYKIAVEQAALDGKPIEISEKEADDWRYYSGMFPEGLPLFNWLEWQYRVARPKVAEGHNPAGVTEDHIPAGWRLFSEEERDALGLKSIEDTRYWIDTKWSDSTVCCLLESRYGTVITQKPAGFYLPKPKVAAGHNPDKLTEEQVGVAEGWRLLAKEKIGEHVDNDRPGEIQKWIPNPHPGHWQTGSGNHGWFANNTYRTKAAPGRFAKPSLKPWTLETFQWPDCVRRRSCGTKVFGVQLATDEGLYIGIHGADCESDHHEPIEWAELSEDFEYSVDHGKTWLPCGTEDLE